MYNASLIEHHSGGYSSMCLARVMDGKILRTNSLQCTGYEDTLAYDLYFRTVHESSTFEILLDGGKAYREKLDRIAGK